MGDSRQTLTSERPRVEINDLLSFVEQAYGLSGQAKPLSSEKDVTLWLRPADGSPGWVVKVANHAEAASAIELPLAALMHLNAVDPDLAVPQVALDRSGSAMPIIRGADGRLHIVSVMSFKAGAIVANLPAGSWDVAAAGRMLARIDLGLKAFTHPELGRSLLWDHSKLDAQADLVEAIRDPERRLAALAALERFRLQALPILPSLRRQALHNDPNPHNVVLQADGSLAVIDFNDMLGGALINDLAVALCYMVAEGDGPLGLAPNFARAYSAIVPLMPEELDVLPALIGARAALSLSISAWRAELYPENAAYILRNTPLAARTLERLQAAGGNVAHILMNV